MNKPSCKDDAAIVANAIMLLLQEGKQAEVLVTLFYHHKKDIKRWILIKRELLRVSSNTKQFYTVASLLEKSTKTSLSESCTTVPGLCVMLNWLKNTKQSIPFFKKKKQFTEPEKPSQEQESYWDKFCDLNPNSPGCKDYEI